MSPSPCLGTGSQPSPAQTQDGLRTLRAAPWGSPSIPACMQLSLHLPPSPQMWMSVRRTRTSVKAASAPTCQGVTVVCAMTASWPCRTYGRVWVRSWDCKVEEAVSELIDQAFHKAGEHNQVPSSHTQAREGRLRNSARQSAHGHQYLEPAPKPMGCHSQQQRPVCRILTVFPTHIRGLRPVQGVYFTVAAHQGPFMQRMVSDTGRCSEMCFQPCVGSPGCLCRDHHPLLAAGRHEAQGAMCTGSPSG